jgi:chemotaxis protein methyltransferase CheR
MASTDQDAPALSDTLLAELSAFVTAHLGLRCLQSSWSALARGIRELSDRLGFESMAECAHWLLTAPPTRRHLEMTGRHLLIAESYFFREPTAFETLRQLFSTELLGPPAVSPAVSGRGGRSLRIWCAGCATGEEPYSIAMLLDQIMPNAVEGNISLLGTDIQSDLLEVAAKGVYRDWSFRGVPERIKERYFEPAGRDCYELDPRIRERVTFTPLNLTTDTYPSELDLILCRNVLMYLEMHHARRVVQGFADALAEGGWLVVGVTETSLPLFDGFETVRRSGTAFYRKRPPLPAEPPGPAARLRPESRSAKQPPKSTPPGKAAERQQAAVALARSGRVDDAVDATAQRLGQSPNDTLELVMLARLHANRGALDTALGYARRAIADGKSDASAHYQHACILNEMNRRSEAAAALRQVIFLVPEFALAHYMLGVIAHADGEAAVASRHLHNALAILARRDPDEELQEAKGLTVGSLVTIVYSLRGSAATTVESGP